MKLTYETGVATLVQFIVLGLLNIVNGLTSIVTTCHHDQGSCFNNVFSSVVFYILITIWFGIILVLGYGAQEKRSRRVAQALIAAEALTSLVALMNIKLNLHYHNGLLSLFTSLTDLVLSIWIITLAYRLMKANGGRVVAHRHRKTSRPVSGQ